MGCGPVAAPGEVHSHERSERRRGSMTKPLLAVLMTGMLLGCAREKPAQHATSKAIDGPAPAPVTAPAAPSRDDPTTGNLVVSPDILAACGISQAETYFAFNSDEVSSAAEPVLRKLAECFTSGPLAHQRMALVGHADPRGSYDYNLVLGSRRAENVRRALVNLGMQEEKLSTSSRGEMDAVGTDEASWTRDRKVEVLLAS